MSDTRSPEITRLLQDLGTKLLMLQEKIQLSVEEDSPSRRAMLDILEQCITDTVTAIQSGDLSCLEIDASRPPLSGQVPESPKTDVGSEMNEAGTPAPQKGWLGWLKRPVEDPALRGH